MTKKIEPTDSFTKEEQITERISLIKNNLMSAYYQSNWSSPFGLQQLINRFFMLLQKRCVIVVLEKIVERFHYKVVTHTCLDPYWKDDFEAYIIDRYTHEGVALIGSANNIIISCGEEFDDYLIPLHGNMYVMLHEIIGAKASPTKKRIFPAINIKEEEFLDPLSTALKNYFNTPGMQRFFADDKTHDAISQHTESWIRQKFSVDKPTPEQLENDWPQDDQKFFKRHLEKMRNIFEDEYIKLRRSPLLIGSGDLPNIFFSIKLFSQQKYRYRDEEHGRAELYPYSVWIVIPKTQQEDLINAFIKFRDKYKGKRRPILKGIKQGKGKISDRKERINDDFFWRKLRENTVGEDGVGRNEGIHDIIQILQTPCKSNARSKNDSVFSSGYVNIKEDPFTFGGGNRLERSAMEAGERAMEADEDSLPYRRTVYLHYMEVILYSIEQDPSTDAVQNLSTLLVPGNIDHHPFFSIGTVFKRSDNDRERHLDWLHCYHFYYLCHYFIHNTRRKIRHQYLEEVRDIYENGQGAIIDNMARNNRFDAKVICNKLNSSYRVLSRVFPFGCIRFDYVGNDETSLEIAKEGDKGKKEEDTPIYLGYAESDAFFSISIHENYFFTRHASKMEKVFLEKRQVEEVLLEANKKLYVRLSGAIKYYQSTK